MDNYDRLDWSSLINELLEILVINKAKFAWKCGVSQTSVSNWSTGFRKPQDYYARKVIIDLAEDNNLNLKDYKIKRKRKKPVIDIEINGIPKDIMALVIKISALSKSKQKKIIDMADFVIKSDSKSK